MEGVQVVVKEEIQAVKEKIQAVVKEDVRAMLDKLKEELMSAMQPHTSL